MRLWASLACIPGSFPSPMRLLDFSPLNSTNPPSPPLASSTRGWFSTPYQIVPLPTESPFYVSSTRLESSEAGVSSPLQVSHLDLHSRYDARLYHLGSWSLRPRFPPPAITRPSQADSGVQRPQLTARVAGQHARSSLPRRILDMRF